MPAFSLPAPLKVRLADALAGSGNAVTLADALALLDGLNGAPNSGLAADTSLCARLLAPAPSPTLGQVFADARAALAATPRAPALPLADRVDALRAELVRCGLDGFVIPHGDEHQSEFIPAASARLAWLTGFSGSAGMAVVLVDKAAIFVDGRYTLQVRDQVDTATFETLHVSDNPPADWIATNLPKGQKLGLDPWLHAAEAVERFEAATGKAGGRLELLAQNPIDSIWRDRPAKPLAPVAPASRSGNVWPKPLPLPGLLRPS
jgi:Xaa-Pro aminopeptidase